MATNNSGNPGGEEAAILTAISGITKQIPAGSTIPIGGTAMTQPQILATLQGFEAKYQAVRDAKTAEQQALAARGTAVTAGKAFLAQLKGALVAQLGKGNPELAGFGFLPKTAAPLTSAQKVVKAAKAKATRVLRGTTSKKQKAAIKAPAAPVVTLGGPAAPPADIGPSASASAPTTAPAAGSSGTGSK